MYILNALLKQAFNTKFATSTQIRTLSSFSFCRKFFQRNHEPSFYAEFVWYFSDVCDHHQFGLYSLAKAGKVSYVKTECKCDSVVEFVGHWPKMYSFTVMDAEAYYPRFPVEPVQLRHKTVAKNVLASEHQALYPRRLCQDVPWKLCAQSHQPPDRF